MTTDKNHRLVIRTPEGIVFSLVLAGPVSRLLAWAVEHRLHRRRHPGGGNPPQRREAHQRRFRRRRHGPRRFRHFRGLRHGPGMALARADAGQEALPAPGHGRPGAPPQVQPGRHPQPDASRGQPARPLRRRRHGLLLKQTRPAAGRRGCKHHRRQDSRIRRPRLEPAYGGEIQFPPGPSPSLRPPAAACIPAGGLHRRPRPAAAGTSCSRRRAWNSMPPSPATSAASPPSRKRQPTASPTSSISATSWTSFFPEAPPLPHPRHGRSTRRKSPLRLDT